jgi:RNA-binding protein
MAPRTPIELSSAERKALRRLAHDLRPVVQIGDAGLTPRVVQALDDALEDHELVKLKINHEREERRELADRAAAQTGSALAGSVGRMAILFRPAKDPERRRIDPSR